MLDAATPEQRAVVHADAHALAVAAGAGTGKTFTLALKARHLVREEGVPAHRVLVITFTREAVAGVKRRLNVLLGRDHGVDVRSFHSFAARALPPNERRFLGEEDARRLMVKAARPALDRGARGRALERVLRAGASDEDDPFSRLRSFVSYCKNACITPAKAVDAQFPAYRGFGDLLDEIVDAYEALQGDRLDFDDVLIRFRDRLRRDEAFRDEVAAGLDALLVDEYQDVNSVQHDIVLLLTRPEDGKHRPRVVVVGDERQAIYGFRGSAPGYLGGFPDAYPAASRLPLTLNFRSQPEVLAHANRLLPGADGDALRPAPDAPTGPPPRVIALGTPADEARFVVDAVAARLAHDGEDPAEIAILARSRHLVRAVDEEIAARVASAQRFEKRRELAVDAVEWLAAFARFTEPDFSLSEDTKAVLGRALAPLVERGLDVVRFTDDALDVKRRQARGEKVGTPPGSADAWRAFKRLRDARKSVAPRHADAHPADAILAAARALPFTDPAFADAIAEAARRVTRAAPDSADAFERALVDALGADAVTGALPSVARLTVHAAKGLEWDHVYLVGAREGGIPSEQTLRAPEHARDALVEEEKRLFYVAATRPRRSFTVTYPEADGRRRFQPSRFLDAYVPAGDAGHAHAANAGPASASACE